MHRAAQAATVGFGALVAFQAALAAGAPLGEAAWGGSNAHLSTAQRFGSAVSILIYVAAIVIVRGRAAGRSEWPYRWGIWALVALLLVSALANVASDSPWERLVLAPVAIVLAGVCVVVGRGVGRHAVRSPEEATP